MQITVKYFGQIAELTQLEEETLEFSGNLVSELLELQLVRLKSRLSLTDLFISGC